MGVHLVDKVVVVSAKLHERHSSTEVLAKLRPDLSGLF